MFIAIKEMNEQGLEEMELDFEVYNGQDGQPHLLIRADGEEYVVIPLDEVNLDIDRSNMIQNEADAELLENIEAGLIIALK